MKFENKYGQVTVFVKNNIITASFSGCVDIDLFRTFTAGLLSIADQFNGTAWGYVSNSEQIVAATPDAEKEMIAVSQAMRKKNCVVSAYIISSPIAINQMRRIMNIIRPNLDFDECLFTSLPDANTYVANKLAKNQAD